MKVIWKIIFIAALCFVLNSCKQKGCMDPKSLNYDIMADEDDGTCLYCQSINTTIANRTEYLIDDFNSSIHYNQSILRFDMTQHADTFNFLQCGNTGCKVDLKVTSQVNEAMTLNYQLYSSFPVQLYSNQRITIMGHATLDMGQIGTQQYSNFVPLSFATITIDLQNPVIYY
jgi:hypothetical protein